MHKFDPDLRTDAEGARNHIKSVRTAHQFSGRAGLEYRFGGQRAQVLIDDPLRLPLLHDLCWIALNSDLRKAAILQASAPIQNWLSAWLGSPMGAADGWPDVIRHCDYADVAQ